jgi:hypothetical protein
MECLLVYVAADSRGDAMSARDVRGVCKARTGLSDATVDAAESDCI